MKEYEFTSRELALLANFGDHQKEVEEILLDEIRNRSLISKMELIGYDLCDYIQSLLGAYHEPLKSANCENFINAFLPKPRPKSKFFIHKCQIK